MVVSVYSGAEAVRQESYLLGTPPRDRWPQTLPLISEGRLATVGVGAELRLTAQGGAPRIVGYGSLEVSFPSSGSKEVELTIARSCSGPPAPGCPDRPDAGLLDAACPAGCGDAEVCFQNHCRPYCDVMTPCTDQNQIICEDPGVCTCTLPCQDGGCFPHACLPNGCCKLQ